ncbi:NACHT domain-containing protein [Nocardiopsis potens]|uniref:NACHT domain-containing protein n=1 Tax=Nocardiopsis potens TaxID=1246458 RepID=UPI00034767A7|nr:AAA family ATPase [Nocardiopsis potens]
MAKKQLTYADALKILGRDDSAVLDFAERLVDGGLGAVGVPDLFGLRGEMVNRGRQALASLREKVAGTSRMDRMERIEAALKIIAVEALFTSIAEHLEEQGAPLSLDDLEMTGEEQLLLLEKVGGRIQGAALGLPRGRRGAGRRPELSRRPFFRSTLDEAFIPHIKGLAAWDGLNDTERSRLAAALRDERIEEAADRKYADSYLRISADLPELRLWAEMAEREEARDRLTDVADGMEELHRLLDQVASGRPVPRRLRELAATNRAVLDRPILRAAGTDGGLVFPGTAEAYVAPSARFAYAFGAAPSSDAWWEEQELREDTPALLAALLTEPRSTESPIVVLGHPGAGKSKLTEMIAARLPASDFFTVRVELRGAAPNAPIHRQIDEGLRSVLHDDTSWRDLADAAEGALPVVILDGFDELLQATGVDRSDYLEQVQEFQRQQQALGQPAVVIVTARTVVAHRMRFPAGCPLIRLEPFDEARVARLVEVWNTANAEVFAAAGLAPARPEDLLAYRELAEQPLLLMMLLVYDAAGNALQRAEGAEEAEGPLSRGSLYEELLAMFARREITKHRPHLNGADLEEACEAELRRLEIVALAMFARHRQTVTAEELEQDLRVLFPDAAVRPDDAQLHGAISDAEQVLGRFFFVHESRARQRDRTASVYEFLHATFGEYLVARFAAGTLDDLVADHARERRRRFARPLDDGLLYAVASFAVFSGRAPVVEFLEELLHRRFDGDPALREDYADLLLSLFHAAPFPSGNRSFTEYAPARATVVYRQAAYSANLVVLLVCCADELDMETLFPDPGTDATWTEWRRQAWLWRSLQHDEWHGFVDTVRVRYLGGMDGPVSAVVSRERGGPVNLGECVGFEIRADGPGSNDVLDPYRIELPDGTVTSKLLRSVAVRAIGSAARMMLMFGPYLRYVGDDPLAWYTDPEVPDLSWSESHDVLLLRLIPPPNDPERRFAAFHRLLGTNALGRLELLALRQAAEDLEALEKENFDIDRVDLERLVVKYLSEVKTVVHGPLLSGSSLITVLDRLEPFLKRFSHPSPEDFTRARKRILDLAAENEAGPADPGEQPHRPLSAREQSDHQGSYSSSLS